MIVHPVRKIINAFWKELGKIAKLTGIKRESIAISLWRLNEAKGHKWEAELWKHTRSKAHLREWIDETRENAKYDEEAFLEIARSLPTWARRSLMEIAKSLPSPHGGKRRALEFRYRQEVKRRFIQLTKSRGRKIPHYKAYEEIRAWLKAHRRKDVSLHTIRIICDPREQHRRREKPKKLRFLVV